MIAWCIQLVPKKFRPLLIRMGRLSIPIGLQMMLRVLAQLVDNLMVGQLSETAIAGVGIANQIFFVFILFIFGVGSGSVVSLGQYWGQKNITGFRKILTITYYVAGIAALMFCIAVWLFSRQLLGLYSPEADVVNVGQRYVRIVALSYPLQALTFIMFTGMRSISRAKAPLFLSIGAVCTNVFLNWVLIFGNLGAPALGVEGAAWGTLITMLVQVIIARVIVVRKIGSPLTGSSRDIVGWQKEMPQYLRVVYPVVLQELGWALGTTLYTVALGHVGRAAVAAFTVTNVFYRLVLVLILANGNATTIVISHLVGGGRIRQAKEYIRYLLVFATVGGLVLSGMACLLSPVIPQFFNIPPESKVLMTKVILAFSLTGVMRAVNIHILVGILRGGADTMFAMWAEVGSVWLLGVPAVFVAAWVLSWPIHWAVVAISLEEVGKLIVGLSRVFSYRWMRQLQSKGQ